MTAPHTACARRRWRVPLGGCCAVALVFALVSSSNVAAEYECDSGVLQMKPLANNSDTDSSCYTAPFTKDSIRAACSTALRARVKNGIVKIVPLVQAIVPLQEYSFDDYSYSFNCKDANASGLFYPGSTTRASVMMFDDYGGPLSNLSKTGANQITLTAAATYSFGGTGRCTYNYTVVQGCVFGIKAPAKPPATCPTGHVKTKGRFGITYCAPCAPGTYFAKSGGVCKRCPVGTFSSTFAAIKCTACDSGSYTNTTGATRCIYCDSYKKDLWTDGKQCRTCPKESYRPDQNPAQCMRCHAGKKCCTVGWDKNCPKCPAGEPPKATTYTSIFALEVATPSICFASDYALCTPKINITVDPTCEVTLSTAGNAYPDALYDCDWDTTVPIRGTQLRLTDLAETYTFSGGTSSIAGAVFTAASSAYLTVELPDDDCTLRYRALTAPAAALLGITPKPSKATSCPAGQYLETATDAKPGPCLRCPPGTYSPRPSSGRSCVRCPAGTYTERYGSTKCKKCPAGLASEPGQSICSSCDDNYILRPGGKTCVACPNGSVTISTGSDRCIANQYGSICCTAGNCKGQAPCKGALPEITSSFDVVTYTATLQLISKIFPAADCRQTSFLSCLPINSKIQLASSSDEPLSFKLNTSYTSPKCDSSNTGSYTGSNTANLTAYEDELFDDLTYNMISNSKKGTVTIFLSNYDTPTGACSATFKLVNGYAFDLKPPKGAKCGPTDGLFRYMGRQFCEVCYGGEFRNSTGQCDDCPDGTYSTGGSGPCTPCRTGYSCSYAANNERPCNAGQYSSKPIQSYCQDCPANTYTPNIADAAFTKCMPCPRGTIAPEGATACGVPWDNTFPA